VWAHAVKNPKTSTLSQFPRSETHPTSTSGISAPTQFTKVTMISSATAPPITPKSSEIDDDAHIVGSLLDEDDEPERLAAHALADMKKQPSSLHTALGAMVRVFFVDFLFPLLTTYYRMWLRFAIVH
jgi:hypothetical protein